MHDWQVQIRTRPGTFLKEIFIFRRVREGTESLCGEKIEIHQEGDEIKPSFVIEGDAFEKLVNAIHRDFKPSYGKYTEGKLEGTERHLMDLRKLLKLK